MTWTTEYIKRELDGIQYVPNNNSDDWEKQLDLIKKQSGLYSSLIYKIDQDWRVGLRYSAMLEYNFSEFNRIRLQ